MLALLCCTQLNSTGLGRRWDNAPSPRGQHAIERYKEAQTDLFGRESEVNHFLLGLRTEVGTQRIESHARSRMLALPFESPNTLNNVGPRIS